MFQFFESHPTGTLPLKQTISRLEQTVTELRAKLLKFEKAEINGPRYLEKLPIELRTKIFTLLLLNPQLGECKWLGDNTKYGAHIKYDLSPALLRTCSWIRDEALPILYSHNTYVMVTYRQPDRWARQNDSDICLPISPLTRYISAADFKENLIRFPSIPSFEYVRRWRVVEWSKNELPTYQFSEFCRAISAMKVNYLDVQIVLREKQSSEKRVRNTLQAMSALHGISSVGIKSCLARDMSTTMLSIHNYCKLLKTLPIPQKEIDETRFKVSTNHKTESAYRMFGKLSAYAQAFEHDPAYKESMFPVPRFNALRNASPWKNAYLYGLSRTGSGGHPVECALKNAREASRVEDIPAFLKYRLEVFSHLEPQFQRMCAGYRAFRELEQKEPKSWEDDHGVWYEEAMFLVEEQIEGFQRDVPFTILDLIRRLPIYQRPKDPRLEHNMILRALRECGLHNERGDLYESRFGEALAKAVNSLVDQYVEVVICRRALLDHDLPEHPCDFDIGLDLETTPIRFRE